MRFKGVMYLTVAAGLALAAGAQDAAKVTLKIDLPKPQFTGTPKDIRSPNLEPARGDTPRPPIEVPAGCDKVISRGCKVTASEVERLRKNPLNLIRVIPARGKWFGARLRGAEPEGVPLFVFWNRIWRATKMICMAADGWLR